MTDLSAVPEHSINWSEPVMSLMLQDLESWWPQTDSATTRLDRQFQRLAETQVLRWVIPREFGGRSVSALELNRGYVKLAEACLPTTFVLTQRNGACQRLARAENAELKRQLLPALGSGELFATVGISHLTTSRQHLTQPVVRAIPDGSGWRIDGVVPWITAGTMADLVVIGATCDSGEQILVVLETGQPGITLRQPPLMMAMNASQTGAMQLDSVAVSSDRVIAGPVDNVMQSGVGAGTGSVTTSALALGLASRAIRGLRGEASERPDLDSIVVPFEQEWARVMELMEASLLGDSSEAPTASVVRERANSLVLRVTQAYLAACKGRGFLHGQAAERLVREAMFFLVWSCPQPVLTAALREFACVAEPGF